MQLSSGTAPDHGWHSPFPPLPLNAFTRVLCAPSAAAASGGYTVCVWPFPSSSTCSIPCTEFSQNNCCGCCSPEWTLASFWKYSGCLITLALLHWRAPLSETLFPHISSCLSSSLFQALALIELSRKVYPEHVRISTLPTYKETSLSVMAAR